jgi:hypothetical protein
MSKKNRNNFNAQNATAAVESPAYNPHAAEYRIIRNDLIRVAIINALFLVGILAVYYTNRQSGYLEKLFNQFIK